MRNPAQFACPYGRTLPGLNDTNLQRPFPAIDVGAIDAEPVGTLEPPFNSVFAEHLHDQPLVANSPPSAPSVKYSPSQTFTVLSRLRPAFGCF
jgi:hypothetical protein